MYGVSNQTCGIGILRSVCQTSHSPHARKCTIGGVILRRGPERLAISEILRFSRFVRTRQIVRYWFEHGDSIGTLNSFNWFLLRINNSSIVLFFPIRKTNVDFFFVPAIQHTVFHHKFSVFFLFSPYYRGVIITPSYF